MMMMMMMMMMIMMMMGLEGRFIHKQSHINTHTLSHAHKGCPLGQQC